MTVCSDIYPWTGNTNKHRYVIATLSQPLRAQLRQIPAVPTVHINRAVMILEPPSDETLRVKHQVCLDSCSIIKESLTICQAEQQALGAAPSELAKIPSQPSDPPRRKKGPKGPNPLSVKKKVVRPTGMMIPRDGSSEGSSGEKRKREGEDEQVPAPQKRKRRRKHGGSTTTPVEGLILVSL